MWDLNLHYRRWVTKMGGVYVRKDRMPPNPYLNIPDRDKRTTDGIDLTMANPAYMTRQVFDILYKESKSGILNRIVSEKYLNPDNKPDEWEKRALHSFEKGLQKEASGVTKINGIPYMRLMKPMYVEEGCLKCHGHQGYKVGDIRGGISISLPMTPFYERESVERTNSILSFLFLWVVGSFVILLSGKKIHEHQLEIEKREHTLKTLFDSSVDWEYWVTEDGHINTVSPSIKTITGYSVEEFLNNPDLRIDIVHKEDRENFKSHIERLEKDTFQEGSLEFRIITKDGEEKWISHACSPVNIGGKFSGRRVVNRDITAYKRLEEHLAQSQKMEAIGTLAGGIAHDFNNMLQGILGYASLLKLKIPETDPMYKPIDVIERTAEKAAELTQQLLGFARKGKFLIESLNLNNLVEEVLKIITRTFDRAIEIKTLLSDELWYIEGDKSQIENVILNLCVNARDAMPKGGSLTITTYNREVKEGDLSYSFAKPGRYVVLSVEDSGIGMDQETMKHIFEPFFTTKEVGKGTGMGLAMVYGVVKNHNGFITVDSELGKGSIFTIYLPAIDKTVSDDLKDRIRYSIATRNCGTILIVDDEKNIREFLKESLSSLGYNVFEASNGNEALSIYSSRQKEIDLVVLDLIMPVIGGEDTLRMLKEINPDVKVLILTGSDEPISSISNFGKSVDIVHKPIDLSDISKKIEQIIG